MTPDFRKIPELQLWVNPPTCERVIKNYDPDNVWIMARLSDTRSVVAWVGYAGDKHIAMYCADFMNKSCRDKLNLAVSKFWRYTCGEDMRGEEK